MDYWRTLLWARRGANRPRGELGARPYWRGLELAMLGLQGRGSRFPEADAYTLLEFGVGEGASFERMLRFRDVLQRRLGIRTPITCVGFDTFAGLPDRRPDDVAAPWIPGDFRFDENEVRQRLRGYERFELVRGLFAETLPAWADRLEREPPLFVSIDCDYYSSTIDVFDTVIPVAPTGCVFYLDDLGPVMWSDRAGELQAVREVNHGRYGEHVSLAEYPIALETGESRHHKTLWRLVNLEKPGFMIARPLTDQELAAGY